MQSPTSMYLMKSFAMSRRDYLTLFGKNKRCRIKRESLYQDITAGGICMVNFDVMIKVLRLAWIPRLQVNRDPKLENNSGSFLQKVWWPKSSLKMYVIMTQFTPIANCL